MSTPVCSKDKAENKSRPRIKPVTSSAVAGRRNPNLPRIAHSFYEQSSQAFPCMNTCATCVLSFLLHEHKCNMCCFIPTEPSRFSSVSLGRTKFHKQVNTVFAYELVSHNAKYDCCLLLSWMRCPLTPAFHFLFFIGAANSTPPLSPRTPAP